MSERLLPLFVIWAAVALVVIGLAVYRWVLGLHEDDSIHIGDASHEREQGVLAARMGTVDRWGKALTLVVAVGGLALGTAVLYSAWVAGNTIRQ
jgi:hypothetical protein